MASELNTTKDKALRFDRDIIHDKSLRDDFAYMCKFQMEKEFGVPKATSKIEGIKLKEQNGRDAGPGGGWTRADRDSGLADEENVEYKVWKDTGGHGESDQNKTQLGGERVLDSDLEVNAAEAMMRDLAGNILGATSAGSGSSGSGGGGGSGGCGDLSASESGCTGSLLADPLPMKLEELTVEEKLKVAEEELRLMRGCNSRKFM